MKRQHLVYVSTNDPDYFVITPTHLAHQAHVDFYWSASDDQLTLVPRERTKQILERIEKWDSAEAPIDACGPCCHAA
ncbi:MAG: hypothetical protein RIA64_08140 [Rhodospirillales bacterium]